MVMTADITVKQRNTCSKWYCHIWLVETAACIM